MEVGVHETGATPVSFVGAINPSWASNHTGRRTFPAARRRFRCIRVLIRRAERRSWFQQPIGQRGEQAVLHSSEGVLDNGLGNALPTEQVMRASRRALVLIATSVLVAAIVPTVAQQALQESARTWIGRAEQIEQFIRDAEVVAIEDIGTGVTNPKRAELAPGGLVARIAFKPIRPGNYLGSWESYESEIAAYELDKLLGLGMVPPTVEKRIANTVGAAVMWTAPTRSFKELGGPPTAPAAQRARWNYQLVRAKMFHDLIYNKDPNLGNWLVDPAWNLILIDNSRAFTNPTRMVHRLARVDRDLWDRFLALDEPTLKAVLGPWLDDGSIRAMLKRRDQMAKDIEALVAERGEAAVFIRFSPIPASPPHSAVPRSHDEPSP